MDNPNFLQYFWDLGSYEEKVSASSIEGIIESLDYSLKSSNNTGKRENQIKTIVNLPEIKNGRSDLEYTISRLIKGLESQRECVRRGYSTCLFLILNRYSIPISNVLEGLERHYLDGIKKELKGNSGSGSTSDTRDRIIGLILGYLTIIKCGFFKTNISRPYIEQIIENLWMLYGVKLYLQDLICEVIYLIIKDTFEYDTKLPIRYVSKRIANAFDSRILDTKNNDNKKNQLASQIPILSLFLKLRFFLENNGQVIINGVVDLNEINQTDLIKINVGNKLEDWKKVFFSPAYPFTGERWNIILANIQYFIFFNPRIPNLFNTLIKYIFCSPCVNDGICYKLTLDIIKVIEENYFSNNYSVQKCLLGANMILKLLVQLKYSAYAFEKSNVTEEILSNIIKQLFCEHSKCLTWVLRTSLIERSPLSPFSILFVQTLIDIIKGNEFCVKPENKDKDPIQNFSEFIFGLTQDDTDKDKKIIPELSIKSLVPYLVNETITQFFWEDVSNIYKENAIKNLESLTQSFRTQLSINSKEKANLFWNAIKLLMLKTGSRMKFIIKIFSEIFLEDTEFIVISQGLLIVDEIFNEESRIDEDVMVDYIETEDDEKTITNNSWKKVHWIHNILLEFVQISFSNSKGDFFSLLLKFSQFIQLIDSIISLSNSNKELFLSYHRTIYPRLEKILGKFTTEIIYIIEREFEQISKDKNFLNYIKKYNEQLILLFNKLNNSTNDGDLINNDLRLCISNRKIPNEMFELSCFFIENCLLLFYIMENFNSNYISNLIVNFMKSSDKKTKLKLVMESMIKLDINDDDYNETDDYRYPNCLSGLNILFQLCIRLFDVPKNMEINQFVEITRRISQLPDLWNTNTQLIDDDDNESDNSSILCEKTEKSFENINSENDELEYEYKNQKEGQDQGENQSQNQEDQNQDQNQVDQNQVDQNQDLEEDEILSYADNSFLSHLLNEDDPLPPKYEKQREQKELEKQQIQKINNDMQNKLRMLETITLISEYLKVSKNEDNLIPLLRSIILLLQGYRIGCKHALYYSMRSTLSIFSDYVKKLAYTINKILHNIFKEPYYLNSSELDDLFKLLIHIISRPIVESQTINRWNKKNNNKHLKTRMENYSRQFENLSISVINVIIILDFKQDQIGKSFSKNLIEKWITQKRFGIITSSFLTKLMHRIKNINNEYSFNFIIKYFIMGFEDTIKYSRSSYQLREYTNLINQAIIACEINSSNNGKNDEYIENISLVITKMINHCINDNNQCTDKLMANEIDVKFNTNVQRLELLNSLISLSKSIVSIGRRKNKRYELLEGKIAESSDYLNDFSQTCNSGKIKRQINKLRNVINNDNKKIRVV